MAKTNEFDRQKVRAIVADITPANMGAGNEIEAKLPQGALLLRVALVTATAFNSGTTATGTISDGTTTFANAVDLLSAGSETVANAPKYYPQGGKLTFSAAQTGAAATAGRAIAVAEYVQLGVGDEVYG